MENDNEEKKPDMEVQNTVFRLSKEMDEHEAKKWGEIREKTEAVNTITRAIEDVLSHNFFTPPQITLKLPMFSLN